MPTIKELGGSRALSIGMKFKDKTNHNVVSHELTSDLYYSYSKNCRYFDVTTTYTHSPTYYTVWYEFEIDGWQFEDFELIEEKKIVADYEPSKRCWHHNTKKVILFTSGYLMCKDCKEDIRTLTEDEYFQAVKEYI